MQCAACGADGVTSGVCARCGYAEGSTNTCPHCGAVARSTRRDASAPWVCAVCGGPRIPGDAGGASARESLRRAKHLGVQSLRSRASALLWSLTAVSLLLPSIFATSLVLGALLGVVAAGCALLALRASMRSRRARIASEEASSEAWLAATEEVARGSRGITAHDLASRLQIAEGQAERLLARLAVDDRTYVEVSGDAEVRYSVPARARVEVPSPIDEAGEREEVDAKPEARSSRRGAEP